MYLIKDVIQHEFNNVVGTQKLRLENSSGMVSSWMFHLQRNDVNLSNEWSNYSNWGYKNLPSNVVFAPYDVSMNANDGITDVSKHMYNGPRVNPGVSQNTGIFVTGGYSVDNQKDILLLSIIVCIFSHLSNSERDISSSDLYKDVDACVFCHKFIHNVSKSFSIIFFFSKLVICLTYS